uniref:Uncharacterized protein n=1 Tax=Kwoniella bestiolae CBS 10118 TaxID=1296100 RepID=A0A1B9G947_9TREE|nr:hypothetical protein I302_02394 [Kwoniella bestiolae CBS 10118]OCF27552.1 hypothetical protein I302_02394 [Kwoniella bestiolae CBS 10118]
MLAPPQRHKRPRSPSPPPLPLSSPDLTSPLDVLLKRRRRDELTFSSPNEHQHHHHDYFNLHEEEHPQPHAESSSSALRRSMKGVERRRTKQWERQNAPASNSQPTPPSHNGHLSTPNQRNWHSQPDPIMSSSPIRNVMPSSSPFRAKEEEMWQIPMNGHSGGGINGGIPVDNEDGEEEEETMEEWNEVEMKKQWGEAYEKQNWLLRSLVSYHLSRKEGKAGYDGVRLSSM